MMENITNQIQPTFANMASAIAAFPHQYFNQVPFEGSWTAGEVAQHVKLSVTGMPDVFKGETETADRKPDEKIPLLAGVFLDFGSKYKSPDFILPEMKIYDREPFIAFFSDYSRELEKLTETLDLSEICRGFEIPGMGPMTRLELLAFALFHTQRHTHQLEKISQALNEKTPE